MQQRFPKAPQNGYKEQKMTYATALDLARERSFKNGSPRSTELYKLLASDPAAYRDYLQLRETIRNGAAGEPALLDPNATAARRSAATCARK
jgi:hypothetical protein